MALTADIVESWGKPRKVIRRLQARGRSEPFAFTFLFVFLLLAVVSVAPFLSRQAALDGKPFPPYLLGACFGAAAGLPFFYALAAIGHLVAKLMGGTGGFYDGRLALFWALACTAPAMLVYGLVRAFADGSVSVPILGGLTFLAFISLYTVMLREVEGQ